MIAWLRAAWLAVFAVLACAVAPAALATQPAPVKGIRFGVLPLGGAVESRALWTPLLADLGRAVGVPVSAYSVSSYEELDRAIGRDEIDMAFLSAKMALDAVTQGRMKVIAQIARRPGMPEHRAVLLMRKAPPFNTLSHAFSTQPCGVIRLMILNASGIGTATVNSPPSMPAAVNAPPSTRGSTKPNRSFGSIT